MNTEAVTEISRRWGMLSFEVHGRPSGDRSFWRKAQARPVLNVCINRSQKRRRGPPPAPPGGPGAPEVPGVGWGGSTRNSPCSSLATAGDADCRLSSVPAKPQSYFSTSKQSPVWSDKGRGLPLAGGKHPVGFASVVTHVGTMAGRDGIVYGGRGTAVPVPHGRRLEQSQWQRNTYSSWELGGTRTHTHTPFCTLAFRVPEGPLRFQKNPAPIRAVVTSPVRSPCLDFLPSLQTPSRAQRDRSITTSQG